MNFAGCALLSSRPESGIWYRAVQFHFLPAAGSTAHTRSFSTRFNDASVANPSYRILYLAENHLVALFEVQALLGSVGMPGGVVPHPRSSWTILNVNVNLQRIVDLTDHKVHHKTKLDTSAQELTGDWRAYKLRSASTSVKGPTGVAPTQELGAALYSLPDLEGFLAISAKLPDQKILVVFPDKLNAASSVTFFDPINKTTVSIT